MAYVSANLNLLLDTVTGTFRLWHYAAGTDAQTAMRVSGYFSDGYAKGMRAGDVILAVLSSGAAAIFVVNSAVAATGVVDVTDGLALAATDTD